MTPKQPWISALTEEEENRLLEKQQRNSRWFMIALLIVVALLIVGTIAGLVRLGTAPFDNSDLFRSV
jgi:hypothetical protein